MFLVVQFGDGNMVEVIDVVKVLEIIYLGLLYYDDVMDGVDCCCGVLVVYVVWGNNIVIFIGDILFLCVSQFMLCLGEWVI